eukprot:gene27132-33814_t
MINKTSVVATVIEQPNATAFTIVLIAGLNVYLCLKPAVITGHTTTGALPRDHHLPGNVFDAMQHSAVPTVRQKFAQIRKLFTDSPRHLLLSGSAAERATPVPLAPSPTRTQLWAKKPTARAAEPSPRSDDGVETTDRPARTSGRTTRSGLPIESAPAPQVVKHEPSGGTSVISEDDEWQQEGDEGGEHDPQEVTSGTATPSKRGRKKQTNKVSGYLSKFNKTAVGDHVVFALKGLYFEADLDGMVDDEGVSARHLIRNASVDATIVQKDIDSLVIGIHTVGLYVLLTPWQVRMFLNVNVSSPSEHHLSASVLTALSRSSTQSHQAKYALIVKLIQETTNCICLADYSPDSADKTATVASPMVVENPPLHDATVVKGSAHSAALTEIGAYGSENENDGGYSVNSVPHVAMDVAVSNVVSTTRGADCEPGEVTETSEGEEMPQMVKYTTPHVVLKKRVAPPPAPLMRVNDSASVDSDDAAWEEQRQEEKKQKCEGGGGSGRMKAVHYM